MVGMSNELGRVVKAVDAAEKKTRRPLRVLSAGVDDVINVLGLEKGSRVSGGRVQRVVKARRR
jgi:hypothetical protein